MKKQMPLDSGLGGCCGKCAPCVGLEKLKKRQIFAIPAQCPAKQRKPQSPIKSRRGERGDVISSDSESTNYKKITSKNKKPIAKEDSEFSICIARKPVKPTFKRKESQETVYISKPKCYKREDSLETVYCRKPKREESFQMICIKKPKRDHSFERKVNHGVDRLYKSYLLESASSESICNGRGKIYKEEKICDKRGKCVERQSSFVTVYCRKPKTPQRNGEIVDDLRKIEQYLSRKKKPVKKHVRRDAEDSVIGYVSVRKDCGEPVDKSRLEKIKYLKADYSEQPSSPCENKRRYSLDQPRTPKKKYEKVQENRSNTSIPEYADYDPRSRKTKQKSRPKSREIRGGISYFGCDCAKRNGLQDQCPRADCQECSTKGRRCNPNCRLSQYSNAEHLTKMKEAQLKKRFSYPDKKGTLVISR